MRLPFALSCFPDFRLEGELISARIPHFFGQSWPAWFDKPWQVPGGSSCVMPCNHQAGEGPDEWWLNWPKRWQGYRMKLRQPRVFRLEARGAVERLPSADSQAKPSADSQAMPFGWQPGCNFFAHGRTEFFVAAPDNRTMGGKKTAIPRLRVFINSVGDPIFQQDDDDDDLDMIGFYDDMIWYDSDMW